MHLQIIRDIDFTVQSWTNYKYNYTNTQLQVVKNGKIASIVTKMLGLAQALKWHFGKPTGLNITAWCSLVTCDRPCHECPTYLHANLLLSLLATHDATVRRPAHDLNRAATSRPCHSRRRRCRRRRLPRSTPPADTTLPALPPRHVFSFVPSFQASSWPLYADDGTRSDG